MNGVDDGSKSLEMTLALLEEAEKVGFKKIVLSSHYMENYFIVDSIKRQKILAKIDNSKSSKVELYLGNEIFITSDIVKLLQEKKAVSLNNGRYVLFELPFNMKPMNIMDVVFQLESKNYIPILAHPERYEYLYQHPESYEDLIDKGVLLQLNYGSFIGYYGKTVKLVAEKLLKSNMAHFIATDVHRPNTLYPEVPDIIDYLTELVGEEKVYELTTKNPELVLENKDIEIEEYNSIKWNFFEKIRINKK